MRACLIFACVVLFACAGQSQQSSPQPSAAANSAASKTSDPAARDATSPNSKLKDMFDAKITAEWEALKKRDKKAYGEFLADDYEGVEIDGRGERNRLQAMNEVSELNIANYTIWGLKVTPLGPDATFLIYEVTMQFPPQSVLRYSRVYIGSLWVKQGTEWKELHYQETHVK
jgi:Domain of unknown function (DUF4440)